MIKRLPWLRNLKKADPEPPLRLPIACGPMSNGEAWWPDSKRKALIRKLVDEKAEEVSRKEHIDRREFMASACGMATTLAVINMVNGCGGTGKDNKLGGDGDGDESGSSGNGGFSVDSEMMSDIEWAECALGDGGNELIIDMQTHFVSPDTNPLGSAGLAGFIGDINTTNFPWIQRTPGCSGPNCLDRNEYIAQILVGSDTTIGVLSGISYSVGSGGMGQSGFAALNNEDLLRGADLLNEEYPGRVLTHAMVMPNDRIDIQLEMMERVNGSYNNWKTYPPWSPRDNQGYWLDSDDSGEGGGPAMIEKGLALGQPIFCIHKGFPLSGFSPTYTNPEDVGRAARKYPDAHLVIFHSAFEHGLASGESTRPGEPFNGDTCGDTQIETGSWPEGPYDERDDKLQEMYPLDRGVNSLIKSLRDNNIGPNGKDLDDPDGDVVTHVYAETGSVWCALLTGRKEEAMHYWGKLLKHIGEDRIVWGTDCLWFGSPQPVIQAFRCFEISDEFQDKYGYPALTKARKEKILGKNAAALQNVNGLGIEGCHSDIVASRDIILRRELDQEFGPRRDMMFAIRGPRTRRDFMRLTREEHNEKLLHSGNAPVIHRRDIRRG